jgi:hypothetical protein
MSPFSVLSVAGACVLTRVSTAGVWNVAVKVLTPQHAISVLPGFEFLTPLGSSPGCGGQFRDVLLLLVALRMLARFGERIIRGKWEGSFDSIVGKLGGSG